VLDDHIRQTDGDPITVYTRTCAPEAFVRGYRFAGRLGKRRQQRLRSNVSYHLAQKAVFTNLHHTAVLPSRLGVASWLLE
jgi:hypothetical protein